MNQKIFLYFCPSFKKTLKKWSKQKIKALFNAIYHIFFLISPILEARAEIQKYFR